MEFLRDVFWFVEIEEDKVWIIFGEFFVKLQKTKIEYESTLHGDLIRKKEEECH